jgi:putative glycosyl hydrolase-like family 6 (GHL6) protein
MNDAYLRRYRRMLLDMHIPGWDEGFLAHHDPVELVRRYEAANVDAVMLYCKSHMGLCYWPSMVAPPHPSMRGDWVGDSVRLLHERDILVCAYDSVAFDHHVVDAHPEWRLLPPSAGEPGPPPYFARYAVVCLNKAGYLDYEKAVLTELAEGYPFDAFFLDMAFWAAICVCDDCRRRFADEDGGRIPDTVDWESETWARFQSARERWADGFIQELFGHIRGLTDVPVYHNFAASFIGWIAGVPLRSFRGDTFLGADLTGGRDEQLFSMKLMRAVSPHVPGEYMATRAPSLLDHVSVKPETEMALQAFGAIALGCAVLFIDAIDPDGRTDPEVYEQVGRVYRRSEPFEALLGGEHLEDVGVYFSGDAFVDLATSGARLAEAAGREGSAHLDSAVGATRLLQRAHIPAGVATIAQLDDLSRFDVLVVPELSRITAEEADAFRAYVQGGGRLYASGRTSLLGVDGTRYDDFLLADLLGVHFEHEEEGPELFLRPVDDHVRDAIAPQRFVNWPLAKVGAVHAEGLSNGPPRLRAAKSATPLAALSLPYAYPRFGTAGNRRFASHYGLPPWTDSGSATVVENEFGEGRVVYSALALERSENSSARALFVALVRRLLGREPTVSSNCHPAVWVEVFNQRDRNRMLVTLVNFPDDNEPIPLDVTVSIDLRGRSPVAAWRGAQMEPVPFAHEGNRVAVTTRLELFEALVMEYAG